MKAGISSRNLGWANQISPDYELIPLGRLVRLRGEKNEPIKETQILSLTADRGVILYEEKGSVGNQASEDISRYSIVRAGDIVVNSMNVIIGSVGLSKYNGVLSPVYYVLTPINSSIIDMRYLAYHFQIKSFQQGLVRIGYGILDHRMRISWINLAAELIVVPPIEEQRRIADHLDEQTGSIDKLSELKLKQIDLHMQLLNSKFTRMFLNSSKSKIPLKRLIRDERLGIWGEEPGESEMDVRVARVADFNRNLFTLGKVETFRSVTNSQFRPRQVTNGDLLLERSGGGDKSPVGCVVYVNSEANNLVSSNFVSRIRPAKNIDAKWLSYLFATLYMTGQQRPHSSQTTGIQNLDTESYFQIEVPNIDLETQKALVADAEKLISDLNSLNKKIYLTIETYQNLKTSVICAAITGESKSKGGIDNG